MLRRRRDARVAPSPCAIAFGTARGPAKQLNRMHERKYLLMIGWTLVSMYVLTFLTIAFSSAVELSLNGDEKFESRARCSDPALG